MIFITNANYDGGSGGTTCNSVDLQGGGNITIHALSTPSQFAGMALYWDTACGATSLSTQSTGFIQITGTIYGGNTTVNLSSSGPVSCTCQIVVKKIAAQAAADITINYDSTKSASPVLPSIVQ
jgi:hypothetical protein